MNHRKWVLVFGAVVVAVLIAVTSSNNIRSRTRPATADPNCIRKLQTANHVYSSLSAKTQKIDLTKMSFRTAALKTIGLELRDVSSMTNGNPQIIFQAISFLGGVGEIIWVDNWTNLPIKLQSESAFGMEVSRRHAVQAAFDAIEASGGCLIPAGENRLLIARRSEKAKYETAIRELGWLDGKSPPWDSRQWKMAPFTETSTEQPKATALPEQH